MTGLGEIIQAKRKELGLTQERLAEKIGKNAGYIGQIERGLSYPSYPVLLQLIETLELDVQSFRLYPNNILSEKPFMLILILFKIGITNFYPL